jgi:membrane protease YdiL (CAAX protease family)
MTAWTFLLLASGLPRIILQEVFGYEVSFKASSLFVAVIIMMGLTLTLIWRDVRSLRLFFILFLVLVVIEWVVFGVIAELPAYKTWLSNPSFNISMLANQSLRLMVTLAIIATLFVMKKWQDEFFLVKGNTNAEAEPVQWLGIKLGERWNQLGRNFAVILSLGTLAFLGIAGHPPLNIALRALPFLPFVLIAAVLNAFNEEMTYKASFLSVLENVVGKPQALMLMAAYFGIGHFYGIPYGVIGVLMAGFLGWFLGKSMLETRGLFWAWLIHFVQDVLIFAFLAIGSITPGGG